MTSGSFDTNQVSYNSNGSILKTSFRYSWSCSQDPNTNKSTIYWNVVCLQDRGSGWYRSVRQRYCTVYGEETMLYDTVNAYNGDVVISGTTVVDHNSDGTGQFSVYLGLKVGGSTYNCTGEATFYLDQIPRYPVISFNSVTTTLNTMTCGISNSRSGTMTSYQVARVSDNVVVASGNINGSFNFTLSNLTPNTSYSGIYKVRAYANGGWGDWSTLTSSGMKTVALPSVSATNVNINESSSVKISSTSYLSSYKYDVKIASNNILLKSITNITNDTTSLSLTQDEIETLLSYYTGTTKPSVYLEVTVTSNGINYRIYTTAGGNPTITYTIPDDPTYQPTFENNYVLDIKDIKNVSITGNNQKFISRHNTLSVTIKPMVGKYGATGNSYSITCGNASKNVTYDSNDQTVTLDNVDGTQVKVTAIDSRGKITSVINNITLIPYTNPTYSEVNFIRQNGTGEYALLTANGTYTNWTGLTKTNAVNTIQYRSKKPSEDTWSTWSTLVGNTNDSGKWIVNEKALATIFNSTEKFNIQLKINDLLESLESDIYTLSTADVFIWKDIASKYFGINKKPEHELDVGGSIAGKDLYINGTRMIWYEE